MQKMKILKAIGALALLGGTNLGMYTLGHNMGKIHAVTDREKSFEMRRILELERQEELRKWDEAIAESKKSKVKFDDKIFRDIDKEYGIKVKD